MSLRKPSETKLNLGDSFRRKCRGTQRSFQSLYTQVEALLCPWCIRKRSFATYFTNTTRHGYGFCAE